MIFIVAVGNINDKQHYSNWLYIDNQTHISIRNNNAYNTNNTTDRNANIYIRSNKIVHVHYTPEILYCQLNDYNKSIVTDTIIEKNPHCRMPGFWLQRVFYN